LVISFISERTKAPTSQREANIVKNNPLFVEHLQGIIFPNN